MQLCRTLSIGSHGNFLLFFPNLIVQVMPPQESFFNYNWGKKQMMST